MQKNMLGILALVVLIGGGVWYMSSKKMAPQPEKKDSMMQEETVPADSSEPSSSSGAMMNESGKMAANEITIEGSEFKFDKATLTEASTTALDQLVTLLKENPHVTIELSAHCDYKGNSEYNKHLSQRRAQSVVDYLIKHGIEKERLTPVGYGKEKPKNVRKKLTEKYPWLKEGDVLNEEFILKQSKEHQEICNQLNRRTEFKVLRTTYKLF